MRAPSGLHVLFVLDTWGLIGGTERHAAVVVPELLARGHRVTVLCREARDGAGHEHLSVVERPALAGAGMERGARRELAATLRALGIDVVFHSALRNVDAAEELLEIAPVVRYVHDHTLFCPGLNKYREDGALCHEPMGRVCIERYFLREGCTSFKKASFDGPAKALAHYASKERELAVARRSHTVLTNSRYMRAELLQVGFVPERTAVLYLFTRSNSAAQPSGTLSAETERFLASSTAPLLFTPARLTLPDKGVDYLITALAAVRRPFRAVVAGAGPAEPWLRSKAVADGVAEHLHFTGWLASAGIERLYERAAAVVCPSVWSEPFGLVGLEAMAHAKPVVAFAVGGIPEWCLDGENGFLVARQDTVAMAGAIDRLLGDTELRTRLGARGRELLGERFPPARHVDGLEAALHAAAGR